MDARELTEREQADLAAYADGSLPAACAVELEARLAESPVLREVLGRQRIALAAARAPGDEPVPERLRARLRAQDASRPAPQRPLRVALGAAAAGLAVVFAVAVAANLSGGPSTEDLAEAAARAPSAPAPARAPELRLAIDSDGIAFPDWAPRLGWRATGSRVDEVGGERVVTVTYARGGREVAYAIRARPALDVDGRYESFDADGRRAVAWIRDGRTCLLLGGDGVDDATLRRLARSVRFY